MTYILYLLYLYMMFSNVLVQYFAVLRYTDECLCLIFVLAALIKLIKKPKTSLCRIDIIIILSCLCLFLFGMLSTVNANIVNTYDVIVKDIVLTFKFFLTFLSVKIVLGDFRSELLSKMLIKTAKIILVFHFCSAILTQFVDIGMGEQIRHGIKCYQFFYSHYTFLVFYVVVLLCTISCSNKETFLYDILGSVVLFLTARTKAIMFLVIYYFIKYIIGKTRTNGEIKVKLKKRYLLLASIGVIAVGYSKIKDYIGWGYSYNLRNALYVRGAQIAARFFPLGSGFGSFGTNISYEYKSSLYAEYNMDTIQGFVDGAPVVSDVFWPSIYSQFGFIGCIIYLVMIFLIFKSIGNIKNVDNRVKIGVYMLMLYLLVASIAEASYTNDIGVFAVIFSYLFLSLGQKMNEIYNKGEIMSKNILVITRTLTGGGAERVATSIATYLSKKYNVFLAVIDNSVNTYGSTVETIDLNLSLDNKGNRVKWFYNLYKKIKQIKIDKNIDIAISFLTEPDLVNILTRRYSKTILSIRNKRSAVVKGRIKKLRDVYEFKKSDSIVSLSKMVKHDLEVNYYVKSDKISVIYNPCDVSKIQNSIINEGLSEDKDIDIIKNKRYIVTAGRLEEQKGQWHLIRAFKKILEVNPDVYLVILGQGTLEEQLKSVAHYENVDSNVVFLGYKKNIYQYLNNAELFVFSSIFEGLGNVLIEALACNLPIVSTDCDSGPREILAPELNCADTGRLNEICYAEYGVLVPVMTGVHYEKGTPLDRSENMLAEAVNKILSDDELRMKYKEKSKQRQQDFSVDCIIQQWEELINNM